MPERPEASVEVFPVKKTVLQSLFVALVAAALLVAAPALAQNPADEIDVWQENS